MKDWLDIDGSFLLGKYKGKTPQFVVRFDKAYLKWIVQNVENISDEDREIIEIVVATQG